MTAIEEVIKRFGRPHIDMFSPTSFRVWVQRGWHVHNGACSGDPVGQGTTLENAARCLLDYVDRPSSMIVESKHCDDDCAYGYSKTPQSKIAHDEFWENAKKCAAEVAKWPAWKRGLPPCVDESCELEHGHAGKHRRARQEHDEWEDVAVLRVVK